MNPYKDSELSLGFDSLPITSAVKAFEESTLTASKLKEAIAKAAVAMKDYDLREKFVYYNGNEKRIEEIALEMPGSVEPKKKTVTENIDEAIKDNYGQW